MNTVSAVGKYESRSVPDLAEVLANDGFVILRDLCSGEFIARVLEISKRKSREAHDALGSKDIGIGSPAQCWHIDSPYESREHQPAHAVNVLVALHDIPLEMGPTEFARGSHRLTNHLRNASLVPDELVYQHESTGPESLVSGTEAPVPDCVATGITAGTCLVFDDRILHRGLANESGIRRNVAYFSYRKKGYSEITHFESGRSLFEGSRN